MKLFLLFMDENKKILLSIPGSGQRGNLLEGYVICASGQQCYTQIYEPFRKFPTFTVYFLASRIGRLASVGM